MDFWNGLADMEGRLFSGYDAGDGVHLNDAGHRLLFERVVASAKEDVVENLDDRTGSSVAVDVDGVVVTGDCAEDVVFDDEVSGGGGGTPDMFANVVAGRRLAELEDVSEGRWSGRNDESCCQAW